MQEYDAKQIEAHAKLAGFDNFETNSEELTDTKTQKKYKTLVVTFEKPVKNPNEVEIEVTIQTKTTSKGDKDVKTDTKTTVKQTKKTCRQKV